MLSLSLSLSMKITKKQQTMVKPKKETLNGSLWLSNLDLVMPTNYHTRIFAYYRFNGAANFFDAAVLKAALSRTLVDFYPYAGRLGTDNNGRMEIKCTAEGVLFMEAECDATMQELGGHIYKADVSLAPEVDYSQGISTFPLFLIQLTRFKCGGVSLCFAVNHLVGDGTTAYHCINTWSDIARGDLTTTRPPFLDRRLLSARNPPQPQYHHIEYQTPPSLKTPLHITDSDTSFRTFVLTASQIKALKQICNNSYNTYTTFEVIAGHVWRCVCLARRLPRHQESKLQISLSARQRLRPPLPPTFFGNGLFYTASLASCGDMESNPLRFAVEKVHEAVARMDDGYMRSAVDYLELQLMNSQSIVRSADNQKSPNFAIANWVHLPAYALDFGWGKPIFVGPGESPVEGRCHLLSDLQNEGGFLLAIKLLKPHMELFQDLIYHFITTPL